MNEKKYRILSIALAVGLIILLVAGCTYGDKYDQLKVVDGEGRVFILRYHLGDTYFIEDINTQPPTPNSEINKKLESKLGN